MAESLINMKITFIIFLVLIISCAGSLSHPESSANSQTIDSIDNTIKERFKCPAGYQRDSIHPLSYAHFLQNFKLHSTNRNVHYYNGVIKPNPVHAAVLDIDVGNQDLQQCADAVMRLRAEYLFQQKRFDEITFRFLGDGKLHSLNAYRKGDTSYAKFRKYMNYVFAYANTRSLKDQLISQPLKKISIGNILIQSGIPYGHAITIMDLCRDTLGNTLALLAQSYMPAQEIHILKNFNDPAHSPWYNLNQKSIYTPEWTFDSSDLMTF